MRLGTRVPDPRFAVRRPKGHVKVQLIDPHAGGKGSWRGRVVDEVEKENYFNQTLLEHAVWASQRMVTTFNDFDAAYPRVKLNTDTLVESSVRGGSEGGYLPMPMFGICCYNRTDAENEDEIAGTINQPIVAWGTRTSGSTTADGTRGTLNTGESSHRYDNDGVNQDRIVIDWQTNQGNGTFQSVSLYSPYSTGRHVCRGPVERVRIADDQATSHWPGAFKLPAGGLVAGRAIWSTEATRMFLFKTEPDTYVLNNQYLTIGATNGLLAMDSADYELDVNGNGQPLYSSPYTVGKGFRVTGCQVGNNIYMLVHCSDASYRVKAFQYSDGAWVGEFLPSGVTWGGSIHQGDITHDGSNFWVVAGTSAGMYRLDGSWAVNATVDLSAVIPDDSNGAAYGIEYDPDDGNFYVNTTAGLIKVDSSGNLIYDYGYVHDPGAWSPGNSTYYPWKGMMDATLQHNGIDEDTSQRRTWDVPNWIPGQSYGLNLQTSGARPGLWVAGPGAQQEDTNSPYSAYAAETHVDQCYRLDLTNAASRVLLPSPVTKTSSYNMKMTYTIDFPPIMTEALGWSAAGVVV